MNASITKQRKYFITIGVFYCILWLLYTLCIKSNTGLKLLTIAVKFVDSKLSITKLKCTYLPCTRSYSSAQDVQHAQITAMLQNQLHSIATNIVKRLSFFAIISTRHNADFSLCLWLLKSDSEWYISNVLCEHQRFRVYESIKYSLKKT